MYPILSYLPAALERQKSKPMVEGADGSPDWRWDWGWRIHPITNERQWHNGVDLPASTPGVAGDPIYAPWDGIVSKVSKDDTSGNYVKINHDPINCEGINETAYCHLQEVLVSTGDIIRAGDLIGYIGSTGRSTGPHLHFITRTANSHQTDGGSRRDTNPLPFLEGSLEKKIFGMSIVSVMVTSSVLLYLWLQKN